MSSSCNIGFVRTRGFPNQREFHGIMQKLYVTVFIWLFNLYIPE